MIDYSYLTLQNPWWRDAAAIKEDDKIKEFESLKFQYNPTQILDVKLRMEDITLITGPRQTGKSTAMKLLIRKLIREKWNPHHLFYFNCDALSNEKDVIDLVIQCQEITESKKTIIFLDEISSVPNWPQGIKWLADAGLTKQTTVFLTGSSSINLKKSGELLPGRRGKGKDINFLPVSFSEYLVLHDVRIDPIGAVTVKKLAELTSMKHAVQKHYQAFLVNGGFLRNINYGITQIGNDLYLKTLKSELYKAGKKEDSMREVVRKILNSLSGQTSYTNVAEEAELGSKNTAIDYLNFLADSFFLKETKCWDIPTKRVVLKKNKKFYTVDPYLVWLFEGFISASTSFQGFTHLIDESRLAENFVAGELLKAGHDTYFYQNASELDFYIPKLQVGVEVKYKEKITHEDIKSLEKAQRKILVSKNTLEKRGDVFIIPIYFFPLLNLTDYRR